MSRGMAGAHCAGVGEGEGKQRGGGRSEGPNLVSEVRSAHLWTFRFDE